MAQRSVGRVGLCYSVRNSSCLHTNKCLLNPRSTDHGTKGNGGPTRPVKIAILPTVFPQSPLLRFLPRHSTFQNFPTSRCRAISHNYLPILVLGISRGDDQDIPWPVVLVDVFLISGVICGRKRPLHGESPKPPSKESRQNRPNTPLAIVESFYIHEFMYAVMASSARYTNADSHLEDGLHKSLYKKSPSRAIKHIYHYEVVSSPGRSNS